MGRKGKEGQLILNTLNGFIGQATACPTGIYFKHSSDSVVPSSMEIYYYKSHYVNKRMEVHDEGKN